MAQNVKSVVMLMTVGIVLWLVGGVFALAVNADAKIVWTCVSGAVIGILAIRYTIRRARRSGL
jgi:O-antigen/teichoic acid export membrane protein